MFYSCSTQRSLLYPSPWYNRNGWLGVKHQVTYCTLKLRGYNRVEITGLSARLEFVQILGLIQVLAFLVFIVVNRLRVKRAVFISLSLFSSVIFVKNYSILSLNRRFNRLQAWANLIGTVVHHHHSERLAKRLSSKVKVTLGLVKFCLYQWHRRNRHNNKKQQQQTRKSG